MRTTPPPTFAMTGGDLDMPGGTGSGFGRLVLILSGCSALIATLLTLITTLVHLKQYRKPLLQRHVIRIFMMVPLFSAASWASLTSLKVAFWVDPFRDVYEAFVLYTFFQLLIAYLGGERSLIIMMHGRKPVKHLWPMNHVFGTVDISDPHSFLSIKRGILQYAWWKPVLSVATVIMKATGTFHEGVISWTSGYLWTSIIYNVSICWSLESSSPPGGRASSCPFSSGWGAIPSYGGGYTADNLAAAIQDALICFEMPLFAISHWYAFSYTDYADRTISDARMPMRFAFRDAFGPRDLIEDAKETFRGDKYEYRHFDAEDNVIAHEESASRTAIMAEGMRYERGGKGKYWIPAPGRAHDKQPLLSRWADSHARTMSPGGGGRSTSRGKNGANGTLDYGTTREPEEPQLDAEEERLYQNARALEFGDWNYPVINTHYATEEDRLRSDPNMISASTNRAILQPGKANRQRRKSRIQHIQADVHQHNDPSKQHRDSASSGEASGVLGKGKEALSHVPFVGTLLRHDSSDSAASHSSQLVDLIVEDRVAEDIERVRARKEGGPGWNQIEQRHFVKTFPGRGSRRR
ncbi:hypothetical protein LTR87_002809 [Friedmanniomyces endolithicus]|nr:hypothetical protein LTR87_002809 [Friedmanniomyces endolithicus]